MKLYLSSYKLGDEIETLKRWMSSGEKKVGYVPNAFDFTSMPPENRVKHMDCDMNELRQLGFHVDVLDLRDYFGNKEKLGKKLNELNMLWVSGGNTFVLRQAMHLSGFDELLDELRNRKDFIYGGYSAACCVLSNTLKGLQCVLSNTLKGLQIVDDPLDHPYPEQQETIWEGLGLLDYAFLPHFDSDHPESEDIDKEVAYCMQNKIPFKTIRDGEVVLVEKC